MYLIINQRQIELFVGVVFVITAAAIHAIDIDDIAKRRTHGGKSRVDYNENC